MKKTNIFFAVMAVLAVVCVVGIAWSEKHFSGSLDGSVQEFSVLLDSGFYDVGVEIQITAPKDAKVYYTVNCEEPTLEGGQLYEKPIVLSALETEEQIHVLRFRAYYGDGTWSETITRTYFVGNNIEERYNTFVLSIVGDPEGLFGYEEGILVPGIRYDEFMEENPGIHPGGGVEANYTMRGDETEREVFLELFNDQGEEIFSQNGGVRVTGAISRLNNQKSLRLYARREYDEENNKFRYDFFEGLVSEETGTMGQEYKRLLLKNSGQDYGYAFVRNELVGVLAGQAGFPDVQHVTPVCVYINGQYYGSYWLTNNYDDQYFENRYGEFDGQFEIIEGGEMLKEPSDETNPEDIKRAEEFNKRYQELAALDMTIEENYEEVKAFMDIENYLQYMAIECYVGNDDWPEQNLKTYRYVAGDSGYIEDSVFDGRYRMLLYDADYGFGLMFYYDTIGCLVNEMILDELMNGKAPLFAALMQREDCRQYFVSYTLDLMNGVMRVENVSEQLDRLHNSRVAELSQMLNQEGLVGGLLLDPNALNMETVDKNLQQIKSYAAVRPEYILQNLEKHFSYNQRYQLTVLSDSAAGKVSRVKVNQMYCEDSEFTGTYFKEIPVILSPCVGPNETFSYWLVNGEIVDTEQLVLEGENVPEDTMVIQLVTEEVAEPKLQICAIATRGQTDYVELVNHSSQQLSTAGYYLSDSEEPFKYELPTLILAPGEKIRLVGKDNSSAESLGQYGLNFNIKTGETLKLTYRNTLIECVVTPKLSEDGVYEKDFVRGIYEEQKRE